MSRREREPHLSGCMCAPYFVRARLSFLQYVVAVMLAMKLGASACRAGVLKRLMQSVSPRDRSASPIYSKSASPGRDAARGTTYSNTTLVASSILRFRFGSVHGLQGAGGPVANSSSLASGVRVLLVRHSLMRRRATPRRTRRNITVHTASESRRVDLRLHHVLDDHRTHLDGPRPAGKPAGRHPGRARVATMTVPFPFLRRAGTRAIIVCRAVRPGVEPG